MAKLTTEIRSAAALKASRYGDVLVAEELLAQGFVGVTSKKVANWRRTRGLKAARQGNGSAGTTSKPALASVLTKTDTCSPFEVSDAQTDLELERRERSVLLKIFDGGGLSGGNPLTSESDLSNFSAIEKPLREALTMCEEGMDQRCLVERLHEIADEEINASDFHNENNPLTASQLSAYLRDEMSDRLEDDIAGQIYVYCPDSKAERAELPFDEEDGKWQPDTMYYKVAPGTNEGDEEGIILHVAGFDNYDPTDGSKSGWCQTSVFYRLPDEEYAQDALPLPEHSQRVLNIIDSLYYGSARDADGEVLTSENIDDFRGRHLRAPLKEALSICEDVMSLESINEMLKEYVEDLESCDEVVVVDSETVSGLLSDFGGGACSVINEQVEKRVSDTCLVSRAEHAEMPFNANDEKWYPNVMYYHAESTISEEGWEGIKLNVAGFTGYDPLSGVKEGWTETSIFYAYPDASDTAYGINRKY